MMLFLLLLTVAVEQWHRMDISTALHPRTVMSKMLLSSSERGASAIVLHSAKGKSVKIHFPMVLPSVGRAVISVRF
jgi:hypothetical protein